jgi:tetratricopeptide (TPR) repeat protein
MLKRYCAAALLLLATQAPAIAGRLDENPDEVFSAVYERLGALPTKATRDPYIWLRLEELKREPCDQKSIGDLALALDNAGYRREAANGLYKFVLNCGVPVTALHRSIDIYLRLTDYPKAVEVADEFIRRAPSNREAHYLRGVALEGAGDHKRALVDYADAIELFGPDKKGISSRVFMHMAAAYAALNRFCEATAPIAMWVALDPASRDNSQTQKIIADYEAKGNCSSSTELAEGKLSATGTKRRRRQGGNQRGTRTVRSRYRRHLCRDEIEIRRSRQSIASWGQRYHDGDRQRTNQSKAHESRQGHAWQTGRDQRAGRRPGHGRKELWRRRRRAARNELSLPVRSPDRQWID